MSPTITDGHASTPEPPRPGPTPLERYGLELEAVPRDPRILAAEMDEAHVADASDAWAEEGLRAALAFVVLAAFTTVASLLTHWLGT